MSGEIGPAALATIWKEIRQAQGQEQGRVPIPLHRVVEEAAVAKMSTQRFAVLTHLLFASL